MSGVEAPAAGKPRLFQAAMSWIAAMLLGAGCWRGALDLLTILDRGVIPGRRGPSVHLADDPLVYWVLIAFFCVAMLTAVGFTAFLAYVGWRQAMEGRRS